MRILTKEQLEKLPTHRLMAYRKMLYTTLFEPSDWCWDCTCDDCRDTMAELEGRHQQIEAVKAVLATREHIPTKPRKRRGKG